MNLITDDWRLKLLALILAVLMMGAVAFSENPTKTVTLSPVNIGYTLGPNSNLIVIDPPTTTKVQVTGLADTVQNMAPSSVVASFDLTKAVPGPNVHANLVIRSLINNVQIQNPVVPMSLDIDRLTQISLPVEVRTPRVAPGWQVTKAEALCPSTPCSVLFTGPSTWESNLQAFADFTDPVQQNTYDVLTQPVLLVQNGDPLDLARITEPQFILNPLNVSIHIEAKTGTTSRQVTLIDAPVTHGPPPGYRVTAITVDPITVVIAGASELLAKITTITLPPVDLTGDTAIAVFKINIPYPSGVTGSSGFATVTYTIQPNPNVSPSPSPSP